ncbi:MAG TPA: YozE family protein [Bacillota bacterium]|nr:YozE family protein [Bacillota bacterium]
MKTFYEFMLTFRGKVIADEQSKLAEWVFHDHSFPKHSTDYDEISDYLEWNSPFVNALNVFDELWEVYEEKELRD